MPRLFSRRAFLALTGAVASGAALAACAPATPGQPPVFAPATPTLRSPAKLGGDAALDRLVQGNIRYVAGHMIYPDQTAERRAQVAQSQSPFAAVLCCTDSRVAPEVVFDQGLGDLFVVRVAGPVLDDTLLGSLEYGVTQLGLALVVVLGHTQCDTVRAALEATYLGAQVPPHGGSLVTALQPALAAALANSGDLWHDAITANIRLVAAALQTSEPLLANAVKTGGLKIVGAIYDLDTGWVELVPPEAKK